MAIYPLNEVTITHFRFSKKKDHKRGRNRDVRGLTRERDLEDSGKQDFKLQ